MAFVAEGLSDKEFDKVALAAGYFRGTGGYITKAESEDAFESWSISRANNPYRLEAPRDPTGLTRSELAAKINAQEVRKVPVQQQQYAIKRQEGLSGTGYVQQVQSMDQRNIATAEALANARAAPGPGRSVYDQRLQQMMLGSFTPDDPSYQWRLEQGMNNLARSGAAKGMLGSGNMAAELLAFGQGMASQEYGAQFNRLLQASSNATNQYTAAYSVLDRMLQQQQAQQNLGLQGEQMAQEWARIAQGWGSQNLGIAAQDTSSFSATSNAQAQASQLSVQREQNALRRDQFNAEQQRLDNWNQGQGAALTQGAGFIAKQTAATTPSGRSENPYWTDSNDSAVNTANITRGVSSGPGSGYIQNNNTGATTSFGGGGGGGGQGYQSWGNDYGYEAVYGD